MLPDYFLHQTVHISVRPVQLSSEDWQTVGCYSERIDGIKVDELIKDEKVVQRKDPTRIDGNPEQGRIESRSRMQSRAI